MMKAETLSQVVSLEEADRQDSLKVDTSRQFGIHLRSRLTGTTKRHHVSQMPTYIEHLKRKYQILPNLRLFAQMRQPGRPVYSDLDENPLRLSVEKLTDKKTFASPKRCTTKQGSLRHSGSNV